jgi:hypothetical protein
MIDPSYHVPGLEMQLDRHIRTDMQGEALHRTRDLAVANKRRFSQKWGRSLKGKTRQHTKLQIPSINLWIRHYGSQPQPCIRAYRRIDVLRFGRCFTRSGVRDNKCEDIETESFGAGKMKMSQLALGLWDFI